MIFRETEIDRGSWVTITRAGLVEKTTSNGILTISKHVDLHEEAAETQLWQTVACSY